MDVALALAVSCVVVLYNNAINRWSPFHGAAYVPVNTAFAVVVTAVAAAALDQSATQIGLSGDAGDVTFPLALVSVFAAGAFGLAESRRGYLIADKRVAGMRGGALAWYVLVRIPIGTALVEETIFRGVLYALWRNAVTSEVVAALCAAIAFGLWHIAPTIIGLRLNRPQATNTQVALAVLGAAGLTTVAGLGLTWLRVWSGGLLAPILLHAGVNSAGALAAAVACRRTSRRPTATF